MKPSFASRGTLTAALLTAFAMFFVSLGADAGAAQPSVNSSGKAKFTIGAGKAGKSLRSKASAIAPAKARRRGKKIQVKAPVKSFFGDVALKGGVRFKSGKRKIALTGLAAKVGRNRTVIKGKLGKRKITAFKATGKSVTSGDTANGSVRIRSAKLSLSKGAAKAVKRALKLRRLPVGHIGGFSLFAKIQTSSSPDPCETNPSGPGCTPDPDPCVTDPTAPGCQPGLVDPYLAQCGVAATSETAGDLPAASPLPTLIDPVAVTGPAVFQWGVKQSFRNYILSPSSGGSLHALDGASRVDGTPGADFVFPQGASTYSNNGTENLADDQAVINGTGTALFCGTKHDFRVAISNPTIVIDGENSRIIADVDSNLAGIWTPAQRVDLADLDLGPAVQEATGSSSTVSWPDLAATFTETGSQAVCGIGIDARCPYVAGTAMDAISPAVDVPQFGTFFAQCGIAATSRTSGTRPTDAPLPTLADGVATVAPAQVAWGFRTAFRGYVYDTNTRPNSPAPLNALDGATRAPGMDPTRGFVFPASGGEYAANDPEDTGDDQVIISGTGTALFCNKEHAFWGSISNPTVVIDGQEGRIVADVASNETGAWTTSQRVDLADLDISDVDPIYNYSGSSVDWGEIPATLSAEAAPFVNLAGGTVLDPVSVAIQIPYDTSDQSALASYVEAELPFPITDPTVGGCTLSVPAGGTQSAARTIDEYLATGPGTTHQWQPNPARPAATPALASGTSVTGGGFDWGFRSGLRSSVNGSGQFNLAGGATASQPYFGNGGSLPVPGGYGVGQGAPASYFTWPTASGSSYDPGTGSPTDDRLALRTAGRVALCQTANNQWYGTIFSNPTVVIDGGDSRVTVDVATRYRLSWVRATVDLATLDMTGINPVTDVNGGTTTVSWTLPAATGNPAAGPVSLTAAGAAVVGQISTQHIADLGLDGTTIRASFPTP